MNSDRVERIIYMEQNLDIAKEALNNFENALNKFLDVQVNIKELSDYYFSKQWMDDYDADNRGEIPQNLKRGVLSEDAAYNLICHNDELLKLLKHTEL
ncbi:MAG: DUF4298 domain-containing protein [Oscillospiraceae bacterium]|nr:DUF4298 domain-containing protein [Oscillospiraceae bacterium]